MVKRILFCAVILTLSLSPQQLRASFKLIRNFQQLSPTPALPCPPLEIYPPETFPSFQGKPARWLYSLPPGNDFSLDSIFVPQLPPLSATANSSPPTGEPATHEPQKPSLSRQVMALALKHLRTPYKLGGSLLTGRATDCSGFVRYIYRNVQIKLPRSSSLQAGLGEVAARSMDFSKLKIGDLLFFRQEKRRIGHVGIYVGEGKMIHASSSRRSVIISNLRKAYYEDNFVVAKRLLGLEKSK